MLAIQFEVVVRLTVRYGLMTMIDSFVWCSMRYCYVVFYADDLLTFIRYFVCFDTNTTFHNIFRQVISLVSLLRNIQYYTFEIVSIVCCSL